MENNQQKITMLQDLGIQFTTNKKTYKRRYGLFKCFCGNEFRCKITDVKSKNTKSCGCLKNNNQTTHGLRSHRLYRTWDGMMQRCFNQKRLNYKNYGAKGISVCDRWLDVSNFIEDMYPTFQEGLSIDRIDTKGNYEPNNCRWATKILQSRNTVKIRITNTSGYKGVTSIKRTNKFVSQIGVNSKKIYLGYFNTALKAAEAYDNYVIANNLEHTLNFKKQVK